MSAQESRPDLPLSKSDPEVFELCQAEDRRQADKIRLIPSENYVSKAVLEASASVFTNKYSEGYAGKRYYEGQQFVDPLESLAIKRAQQLFGADHVNVQPYSGSPANVSKVEDQTGPSDETKQVIVLIIDEAQHAITTDPGIAALFALKAARDELNSSHHHGLRVVCTGSNRDKLAMLRNSKDQAFYGAPMVNFPMLGKDFIEWFCQKAELPFPLSPEKVWPLFVEAGYRPELLGSAADTLRFNFEVSADTGPDMFENEVRHLANEINQVQRKVIRSLTPIQQVVLRVMAATGSDYAPFEASTMELYRRGLQLADGTEDDVRIDVPGVQQALLALQEKKLVWRAARGVYAIEEQTVTDILATDGLLRGLDPPAE